MDSTILEAPYRAYAGKVEPSWLDYNGHMNVAYYTQVFDDAIDRWWGHVGLGPKYIEAKKCSAFAVEAHVIYKRELHAGDSFDVTAQLLGFDAKRMHLFFELLHAGEGFVSATQEMLVVHVDMTKRAAVPFPEAIVGRLQEVLAVHAKLPQPAEVGRQIAMKSRRTGGN
ncbi:MAG: thioesterase family protein [Pseudomonadota bacterium]